MSNVVSIACTCDYLVQKALKHRRAGRYDEAMALLWKAKSQFGLQEEIEMAFAAIYDEIGCESESARAYLRVVHLGGDHKQQALFQLSLSAMERGDLQRSASYFEHFSAGGSTEDVSNEMAVLLGRQILAEIEKPKRLTRKKRARMLEQRAAHLLQEGKAAAAQRTMIHALRLRPRAQGYTMLACCHLIRGHTQEAVEAAKMAHRLAPSSVQTLCVLSDAYTAAGQENPARKAMRIAALRAKETDDLLAVAIESAKYGEDQLTLHLTQRILKRESCHTRSLMLRACAMANLGRMKDANRLFARLCGLLPEDTVCESYFRMTHDEKEIQQRLTLGMDVTREEGINRAAEMISALCQSNEELAEDVSSQLRLCRLCDWALHSSFAGSQTKAVACALLGRMTHPMAQQVLLDALTDPVISDAMKLYVLQILTEKTGFKPYHVDLNGRLVRLAAGGVSEQPVSSSQANSRIVQQASDALCEKYPDAPQIMLDMFLLYLNAYGYPTKRHEAACAAALESLYFEQTGRAGYDILAARDHTVSRRLVHMYIKRFHRCLLTGQR